MRRVSISKAFLEELDIRLGFQVAGNVVNKHVTNLEYYDFNRRLELRKNEES